MRHNNNRARRRATATARNIKVNDKWFAISNICTRTWCLALS